MRLAYFKTLPTYTIKHAFEKKNAHKVDLVLATKMKN